MNKFVIVTLCGLISGCTTGGFILDGPSHFTEGRPYWGGDPFDHTNWQEPFREPFGGGFERPDGDRDGDGGGSHEWGGNGVGGRNGGGDRD